MAVIQYGSVVTEIKGSLGGHTFKSQRGTKVIMQKSNGYSRSKQLSNRALGYAGFIFQAWSLLADDAKLLWENSASGIFFPDKYGSQVHISGRDLFTKCNLNLGSGYFIDRPSPGFSAFVTPFQLIGASVGDSPFSAVVQMQRFIGGEAYFDVTAEVSVNRLNAPVFRTRELLQRFTVSDSAIFDVTTPFFKKFPYVQEGYFVRFYVTVMNLNGLKGETQYIDVVVGQTLPLFDLSSVVIQNDGSPVILNMGPDLSADWLFQVRAHVSTGSNPSSDFSTATYVGLYNQNTDGDIVIINDLKIAFPDLGSGNYVRFFVILSDGVSTYGAYKQIVGRVPVVIPDYVLEEASVTASGATSNLEVSSNSLEGFTFDVYAVVGNGSPPADVFSSATYLGNFPIGNSQDVSLEDSIYRIFGFLTSDDYVRFYTILTLDLIEVSPPQTIVTQVIEGAITWALTDFNVVGNGTSSRFFYTGDFSGTPTFRVRALVGTVSNLPSDFSSSSIVGTFTATTGSPVNMGSAIYDTFGSIGFARVVALWVVPVVGGVEIGSYQLRYGQVLN